MADLFDFGGEMPPLDEGPEADYDEFNDETFGEGAEAGDWEQEHERLAQNFGDLKPLNLDEDDDYGYKNEGGIDDSGFDSAQKNRSHQDDLEKSMTQFVLDDDDDDDDFFDPAIMSSSKQSSRPIPIGGGGSGDSNMSQLFGPSSPPALFDPSEFMSPSRGNIWGSPNMSHLVVKPKSKATEEQLKAMLNIGGGGDSKQPPPLEDAAIVKAVPEKKTNRVFTVEELERDLTSRAPPRRTKSPVLGSPPPSSTLPIGTPPRHHFMQKAAPGLSQSPVQGSPMTVPRPQQTLPPNVVHNLTQQILKNINGRVSPTHIAQLILHMHNTSGRVSPNQISQKLMFAGPPVPLSSSPGKPPPRMMHPGMRPPPPMMPFSPGGPGRMPHPHTPPGGMHPHPRARPPMGYMYGLTPMHPRIPPLHARSDPGPRGRFQGRFPPNQYNQNRSRTDMRQQQRPFNRRYDNQRHDNRGPRDEYANLMSQREKDWVIKIQMLQLQTNNPYLDDYYYQTYMQKKSGKDKDQGKDGVQSEERDDGKENKAIVPQPKQTETKAYQPTQFAGALGRLTSSSVNNPRQIIDIHIGASTEEEETKAKDHSRRRRVLLSIERVYSLLLEVDDLEKQVLALPESDRGQQLERKQVLVAQMYALLKADAINGDRASCDHFIQVLSIRKGRKLVSRVIPYLDKEQALVVVRAILQNFGFLLKREMQDLKKESPEETLPQLYMPLSNVVKSTNLKELTNLVHSLIARQPGVSPNRKTGSSTVVTSALQNKFGVSVVLNVLNQGEHIFANTSLIDMEQDVQFQWIECVNQLASDICVVSDTSISEPLRPSNYDNVLPHFARFVSKQSYNALDRRLRSLTSLPSR